VTDTLFVAGVTWVEDVKMQASGVEVNPASSW